MGYIMTTLDDILAKHLHEIKAGHDGKLKQELQDLMLRVIGEDIEKIRQVEGSSVAKYYVNKAKADQRKRLNELFKEGK